MMIVWLTELDTLGLFDIDLFHHDDFIVVAIQIELRLYVLSPVVLSSKFNGTADNLGSTFTTAKLSNSSTLKLLCRLGSWSELVLLLSLPIL